MGVPVQFHINCIHISINVRIGVLIEVKLDSATFTNLVTNYSPELKFGVVLSAKWNYTGVPM